VSFFVIDDIRRLPRGQYEFRPLQHEEAREALRGKFWGWYIENKEGETFYRLKALARESGLTMDGDNLEGRELPFPRRLNVGAGHTYLVLLDHHESGNGPTISYCLFGPVDAPAVRPARGKRTSGKKRLRSARKRR
jgi:hypothetical protein